MASTQQLLLGEGAGGAEKNYIEDVFSTYLYSGNGASRSIINNIDLSTEGGLVWTKCRNNSGYNRFNDTARGATNSLASNSTNGTMVVSNGLTAFNTDGYTLGDDSGNSGYNLNTTPAYTYVSWTFRKQPKFFDVVTFTAPSSGDITINHNLGSVPGCVILKRTDGTGSWVVNHRSLSNTEYLLLNSSTGKISSGALSVSYSTTSVTYSAGYFTPNSQWVAYFYAHDAGGFGLTGTDNVISCGSTGGGSSEITLGWEPQWLLYRSSDFSDNWHIIDNMRGAAVGSPTYHTWSNLNANTSTAETSVTGSAGNPNIKFTATGFVLGAISGTAIYIAIRRGPMKVPTDATKVFAPVFGNSSGTIPNFPSNIVTDLGWMKTKNNSSNIFAGSRLQGANTLFTNLTNAEAASSSMTWDSNSGWGSFGRDSNNIAWSFQRAPSFFDEVCYTGTGSYPFTINHNLGVSPELIIFKSRSNTQSWYVYASPVVSPNANWYQNWMMLNATNAAASDLTSMTTAPTSSAITIAESLAASSNSMVAYLFATCAGVSKVGSYTGTGTTKQVDCGFAAGARFVLIKKTSGTGSWYVWDSSRGITSGNDPYLLLNSTAAEVTSTDYIDTYSAGFEISSTAPSEINENGGSFIFLAIA